VPAGSEERRKPLHLKIANIFSQYEEQPEYCSHMDSSSVRGQKTRRFQLENFIPWLYFLHVKTTLIIFSFKVYARESGKQRKILRKKNKKQKTKSEQW